MKYHWIAAAALIVCSCSVEEISDSLANNGYPSEVTARIDDYTATPETRAYVDENMKILWNQDDRISLFNKYTYNKEYLFKGSDGANSGVFKEVTTNDVVVGNPLDKAYAVYPYMELTEVSNSGVITLELPSEQTYKKNSFGRGDNVMVSATTNTDLVFKNLCGYLVLKLYGDDVSVESISLRGNNGEILAGKADVTADVGSTPTMAFRAAGVSNTITLNCEPPVKLGTSSNDATVFWIVVPPTIFSSGFTLTITDSEGNVFVKESLSEKEIVWNSTYRVSALKVVPEYTGNIAVKSISLNKTSLSMVEGQSETLVATVAPENATDKTISWSSSDQSIVAVDEDGTLNALSPGTAIITAQAGLKKATCKVTVNEAKNNVIYYTSVDGAIVRPNNYSAFGANIVSNEYKNGQGMMVFDGDVTVIPYYDKLLNSSWNYLSSITIPNSVTAIGNFAFSGCSGLTSITIPNNVTTIGSSAFSGCSGLTSITIPNSVTTIEQTAFKGCTGLVSVTIPDSVISIGQSAFDGCSSLASITIPSSVTIIEKYTFNGCSSLASITIPSSVATINSYAFDGCQSLHSVTLCGDTQIYQYAFSKSGIQSLIFKEGVTTIDTYAFYECSGLNSVVIPNSMKTIGGRAFDGCTSLTSINIPNSVTTIGAYAFNRCTGLTSIDIPSSLTTIESGAFASCANLTAVDIPESVTTISEVAFAYCTGLISITIPGSVTAIEFNAFNNCTGLTSIILLPTTPPSVSTYAFSNTSDCPIYVPANSVEEYKTVQNWSFYADRIQAIPE